MKSKWRFLRVVFAVALTLAVFSLSCGSKNTQVEAVENLPRPAPQVPDSPSVFNGKVGDIYCLSCVKTVGNRSYIPINRAGVPEPDMILPLMDQFEKAFPACKITAWKIEKQQAAKLNNYLCFNYIFGIWVDHELR